MTRSGPHIYLDYSATTPLDTEVTSVIDYHLKNTFGNASSIHAIGRTAKVLLEESREIVAKSINAEPSEVFFTSGGTESDNHAIAGVALAQRRTNGKKHIIISSVEHHAVLDCAEYLHANGFEITRIPVKPNGVIDMDSIDALLTPETGIVSVMHANNETGAIQPLEDIARIAHTRNAVVHSDTVQTIGKIPVDVNVLGVDLLAISSHKIYGPKGIGAIYIRKGTDIDALLHGGAQERNNRAGTENIPSIAGFAKAVENAEKNRKTLYDHAVRCKSLMIDALTTKLNGIIINGEPDTTLPHILSLSLDPTWYTIDGEMLLLNLDLHGIAVSSGSACTSGSVQPSHVLLAMGRDERTTRATVRFSFGRYTTFEEIEKTVEIFRSVVIPFQKK